MKNSKEFDVTLAQMQALTEKMDKKQYFGIYAHGLSNDDPLSVIWGNEKLMINEGLVKTYSLTSCKKHMINFLGFTDETFRINTNGTAMLIFPASKNNYDTVLKAMNLYGYYVANKNPEANIFSGNYWLTFEPKYQDNANDLLKNEKYLCHISPKVYKEKILKNGFIPYNRNSRNNFPGRVYFLFGSNKPELNLKMLKMLSIAKYGRIEQNNYCVFKIDVSKLPSNAVFHTDPNMDGAIWTYDNIPPSCIVDVFG